jgi:hypothetical protein
MTFDRLRLAFVNALIAAILAVVAIETLPQSPSALRTALQPLVQRVGLAQGWGLFCPPDRVNTHLRAEITYRDGQTATWRSPDWRQQTPLERFVGHRRSEWYDQSWGQEDAPVWPAWSRTLAREARPDLPDADRGAEVKIIVEQANIPSAEIGPWTSWRSSRAADETWTLTIEPLP